MLRRVLAATAAVVVALTGALTAPASRADASDAVQLPNGSVVMVEHLDMVRDTFDAINDYRASKRLGALRFAPDLFEIAQSWSDQLVTTDRFEHRKLHWKLYPAGWDRAGEIIAARSNADTAALVRQWINSSGHEAIMVSDATVMAPGIALDTDDVAKYFMYGTVNFGRYDAGEIPMYNSIDAWIAAGGTTARDDVVGDVTSATAASDGTITVSGWALDFSSRNRSSTVRLTLDGRSSATVTADRTIEPWGAGEWRLGHDFRWTVAADPGARHEVCAVAQNSFGPGQHRNLGCKSVLVPMPDPEIPSERVAGANRYTTAVAISTRYNDPAEVSTVYLATGEKYPDALSLAPAAAQPGNALLLTPRAELAASVAAELRRLAPETVVIVGSEHSVSARVAEQVAAALPYAEIARLAGANRYETSVMIADHAFPAATLAYVASGQVFPDALSAAPVAAGRNAPVILTPAAQLPQVVQDYVANSSLRELIIAGGTPSVSAGVASQLEAQLGFVPQRIAGANRFETNLELAATANSGVQVEVLLASGLNFPDALAGAAVASNAGPLLLARTDCVPRETVAVIHDEYLPETLVVLGGTATLRDTVADLVRCA
ncbi:cell wall-binding repeat-containing protein [Agrococcus sp. ProA11]|uniref:cell wall-binding repeat-containing protein n=1 Tax=Agrococcus chionoecetis TaxID=3153752 RepID=UPI00326162E9